MIIILIHQIKESIWAMSSDTASTSMECMFEFNP